MADQSPFRFLDLPPELRNEIYYFALGEHQTSSEPYGPTTCTALAPPALTRTNRQIRNETLGLYYSQNRFSFQLPVPGGQDAFQRWCAAMGPHLQFIGKSISFTYSDTTGPRHYLATNVSYKLGFELCSDRAENDPRRVGHDTLDVNNPYAISHAFFYKALSQDNGCIWMVGRRGVFDKVTEALCAVAPLCPQVNSRIYMTWSLPYLSFQSMIGLTYGLNSTDT
ncbi:hypothetical protein PG996_006213 [Apiospora saccharicola]|uniref:2EXR domain-containing protein n=1 Tax=Apiospora saccharicola TaxID=335842 RepID=A0ABR1VNP2_9PEZI